jgi:hypothetical protein
MHTAAGVGWPELICPLPLIAVVFKDNLTSQNPALAGTASGQVFDAKRKFHRQATRA